MILFKFYFSSSPIHSLLRIDYNTTGVQERTSISRGYEKFHSLRCDRESERTRTTLRRLEVQDANASFVENEKLLGDGLVERGIAERAKGRREHRTE